MNAPRESTPATECRITGPAALSSREFKTYLFPLAGPSTADLPAPPGAVQHDPAGRPTLLHFAPGRFLAPAPTPEIVRHLDALAAAGVGSVFDVSGKWRHVHVAGPGADRLLASGIDVAAVLSHRDCAAVQLFDCPVVLARASDGYDLWVQASYALDFCDSLRRISGVR